MNTSTQTQNGNSRGEEKDGGLNEMARRKGIDKPTYTQTPNILFDELMRDMGEAELKVTLAIMRLTFGWHRQFYEMSLTDLQEYAGLSRPSVTKGINAGIRRGTIRRRQDADLNFYYGLVVNDVEDNDGMDYPLVKKPKSTSKNSLPVEQIASKNSLLGTSKNSLPVEPVTSKEFLPEVVNNFYQNTQALKKGKESTTKEREKEKGNDGLQPSPLFEEFIQELCVICYGHKETATLTEKELGALRREAKKIRGAGFDIADLRAWMTGHWFKDWRWKKDQQRPTPAQVRSSIAKVRAAPEDTTPRKTYRP